jgi:hypothetical protein
MKQFAEYRQLRATGLWRERPDAQRRNVTVSIGEATLTLTGQNERVVAHWSLPALTHANPGHYPAIFHPDGNPGETLELAEDQAEMIRALNRLCTVIERSRPHPGRLRMVILSAVVLAVLVGGVFWLPDALRRHAVTVVPQAKRATIGAALMSEINRVSGPACDQREGQEALDRLGRRVAADDKRLRLLVVREGVKGALLLPGRVMLLNRTLFEDYEEPDVAAGFILAELVRSASGDPLAALLDYVGVRSAFQLLTTGDLPRTALRSYAEHLLTDPRARPPAPALLARFRTAQVRSSPYAFALDVTGETVLGLVEADPFAAEAPPPLLRDFDWLRLQDICGG